jgi:hypothetical protein
VEPDTSTTQPRWGILALLFAISAVTYMDRVNISVTARQMMPAYGLTDQDMGYIFSAAMHSARFPAAGSVIAGARVSCWPVPWSGGRCLRL